MGTWQNHALFTKHKKTKFCLPLKLWLLRRSHPKSAMPAPNNVLKSAPDFIQIDSLS